MIVGPVGCGKSSLLSAILGEMQLMDGSELSSGRGDPSAQQQHEEGAVRKPLARKRRIAYTAQTSWLESATIRENILFGRRFDAARYKQAVHVAALEPDLARFVDGDGTVVGENGLNLSGSVAQAMHRFEAFAVLEWQGGPLLARSRNFRSFIFCLLFFCFCASLSFPPSQWSKGSHGASPCRVQ